MLDDLIDVIPRRQEIKMVIDIIHLDQLLSSIYSNIDGFKKAFPSRINNNIYFDNMEYTNLDYHYSGTSFRKKVRLRWYGHEPIGAKSNLEVKWKKNIYGWKKRFPVECFEVNSQDNWINLIDNIISSSLPPVNLLLKSNSVPVLLNKYHRDYYESGDQSVRVTVDTKIETFPQHFRSFINNSKSFLEANIAVVEIKFDEHQEDSAIDFLTTSCLRITKYSKYVSGYFNIYPY
jgi:hypothetical protein